MAAETVPGDARIEQEGCLPGDVRATVLFSSAFSARAMDFSTAGRQTSLKSGVKKFDMYM
jgi:hypothetical protein